MTAVGQLQRVILFVMLMCFFVCCGDLENTNDESLLNANQPSASKSNSVKEWTYMVYIAGDSNLSASALKDIKEMQEVGSSENVSIVVQAEFSSKHTPNVKKYNTYRAYIEKTTDGSSFLDNAIDIGNVNMADSNELTNFILWAKDNYPARHYSLVIWGHGDGWRLPPMIAKSVIIDESSAPNMSMSNKDLATAIENSKLHFDIINFDSCLMAMYEILYDFKGLSDYFIASADSIPGDGFPYNSILNKLVSSPGISGKDLAAHTVDSFYVYYSAENKGSATLAAFELEKVDQFDEKIRSFASSLANNIDAMRPIVKTIQQTAISYHLKTNRDLGSFVRVLSGVDNQEVATSAKELESFLAPGKFIIDHRVFAAPEKLYNAVNDFNSISGVAIYFPTEMEVSSTNKAEYATLTVNQSQDMTWHRFLFDYYLNFDSAME